MNSMLTRSFNPILIFFLSNTHTVLIPHSHIFYSIQCQNPFNLPGASAAIASLSVRPSDPAAILVVGKTKINVAKSVLWIYFVLLEEKFLLKHIFKKVTWPVFLTRGCINSLTRPEHCRMLIVSKLTETTYT